MDHDKRATGRKHIAAGIDDVTALRFIRGDLPTGLVNVPQKLVAIDYVQKHQPHPHPAEAEEDGQGEHHDPVVGGEPL